MEKVMSYLRFLEGLIYENYTVINVHLGDTKHMLSGC